MTKKTFEQSAVEYRNLKAQMALIEKRLEELSAVIKSEVKPGEPFRSSAVFVEVTSVKGRETFQFKEFERAHPEVDLTKYFKIGEPSLRITVK